MTSKSALVVKNVGLTTDTIDILFAALGGIGPNSSNTTIASQTSGGIRKYGQFRLFLRARRLYQRGTPEYPKPEEEYQYL